MPQQSSEHRHRLKTIYRRRLEKLQEQQATFGVHAPAYISIEIEDINNILSLLENADHQVINPGILGNLRFQNQIEALNTIMEQTQIGNFIIEGPAGYGKTYLLDELKLRLINDGWYVQMISLRQPDMPPEDQEEAIGLIGDTLGIKHPNDAETAGYMAATVLHDLSIDTDTNTIGKGAFLLIDSAELMFKNRGESPYVKVKAFISGINQASADFDNFKVRVIVSGRYIVDDRILALNAPSIRLKVFDLNVVRQAVDSFLSDRSAKRNYGWTENFAKHVLYITGGHPLMIRQLLTKEFNYYTKIPKLDLWLVNASDRIKNNIIIPAISEIRKDIPEGDLLWGDLLRLSVFRRFNKQIIRKLFPNMKEKPFQYTDKLERYSLVIRDDSFYKDGVLRPAMVRWLQFTDYERLKEYCSLARAVLVEELKKPSPDGFRPPSVVRELLYIHLLELHNIALDASPDLIIENHVSLQLNIQNYIEMLRQLNHTYDIEELIYDLRSALQSDNEIYFLYDYIFQRRALAANMLPDYALFVHHLCGNQHG